MPTVMFLFHKDFIPSDSMYEVFEVEKDNDDILEKVVSDDLVSKQNTTIREGQTLGLKDDMKYLLIEGKEEAIEKAKDMFSEEGIESSDDAEKVKKLIDEEDEAASAGMGTVFG